MGKISNRPIYLSIVIEPIVRDDPQKNLWVKFLSKIGSFAMIIRSDYLSWEIRRVL